ncbi:protein unc-93 homolog A-like [Sycon ciliatum]|uniref:protein unc-93 homolog A-like n=1 Tax=Sycon ciliatum TaxID=27933 RepID=UPI0031F618ED
MNEPSILRDALGDCIPWRLRRRSTTARQVALQVHTPHASGEDIARERHGCSISSSPSEAGSGGSRQGSGKSLTDTERKDARIHAQNTLVTMLSTFFVKTPFYGLLYLESSINAVGGLGEICYAMFFIPALFSVTLLGPLLTRRLGIYRVVQLSLIPFSVFVTSHFKIIPGYFLTTCAMVGMVNMMLGSTMVQVANTGAAEYASIYGIGPERVSPRFNSIVYGGIVSSSLMGSLISSLVLHNSRRSSSPDRTTQPLWDSGQCNYPVETLVISGKDRKLLLSIYLGVGILGLLVSLLLRQPSKTVIQAKLAKSTVWQQVTATLRLIGNIDLLLLIPVFFAIGLQKEALGSNITSFFITPCLGVGYVGYSLVCYSTGNFLGLLIIPTMMKHANKVLVILGAMLVQLSVMLTLLLWQPTENMPLLFGLVAMWGIGDAMWNVPITVILGAVFTHDQEAASANYKMWQGMASGVAAFYSQRIGRCTGELRVKFVYHILMSVLGAVMFCIVEWRLMQRRRQKNKEIRGGEESFELLAVPEQDTM